MRKSEIDDLLGVMLESYDNVSDLNVTCERPLQVEAAGELVPVPVEPSIENLTPFQTEIFAQRGNFSVVLRKLETSIPTIEDLKLPEAFKKMPAEKNGLILVTGATG